MPEPKSDKKDEPASQAAKKAETDPLNPHVSQDPNLPDEYQELDPEKVVGTYAMQPDPNDERPAPQPNVPEGVNKAPADDEPDAKAIGSGEES